MNTLRYDGTLYKKYKMETVFEVITQFAVEEDILQLLKKELEELQGEMYEDIQNKLVELVSVYGNMILKKLGGRWEYVKSRGKAGVDIPLFCRCNNPVDFIEAWQKGEENLIIENFNHKCNEVINWVRQCRRLYGKDWQPPETKYLIPPM